MQKVSVTLRSMVMTGILALWAASRAGVRPSELTGATTRMSTFWLMSSWMSEICFGSSELALVTTAVAPAALAASLMDFVSAARKAAESGSDWENPILAPLSSTFGTPSLL